MTRLTKTQVFRWVLCAGATFATVGGPASPARAEPGTTSAPTELAPRFFEPGPATLWGPMAPALDERLRIQRHLREVELTLRATHPPGLTDAQREARARALDALQAYWVAGEFPKNRDDLDRRVPIFIDADGTACAVGHLMIASGASDLAREIATYENYDFVADIDHPELTAWLTANGLTAAEAAWIQPTYGPCGGTYDPVCGSDGLTYQCEHVARECAGIEVEHDGWCEDDLDEEGEGEGDYEAVVSDGICKTPRERPQPLECAVGSGGVPVGTLVIFALAAARRRRRH